MALDEMKLAVCQKLAPLVRTVEHRDEALPYYTFHWDAIPYSKGVAINWQTEGLQVCHEAEKLIPHAQTGQWLMCLGAVCYAESIFMSSVMSSSYKQRLEALCRIWFPEKWKVEPI